jgi:hypothetical protein
MRLQLSLGSPSFLMLLAWPSRTAGKELGVEPVARFGLYQDSDKTTIWTAATGVKATLGDRFEIGAQYLVDVVSSASVDVISQATGAFHDTRHDISARGGYRDPDRSLSLGYGFSIENDWTSHNVGLSGSHELLHKNLTLAVSLGFQHNLISRANSAGFAEDLQTYLGSISLAWTATPRDLLQLSLAPALQDGFLSSPYRYLFIDGQAILERYPGRRFRQSILLRHHHYFDAGFALRTLLRGYGDTFGILALTLGAETAFEWAPFDLTLAVRGYGQRRARFYRETYDEPTTYVAIDKELATFVDVFAGPSLGLSAEDLGPFARLRVEARASGFYFYFVDFAALEDRYGVVVDLGVTASF